MRRAASPPRGEARPQKRICPPQSALLAQICHNHPSGFGVQNEFTLIFPRSGSWGMRSSFPSTVRPFVASGPRVRGHSRFSPAAYGHRAGHLLVQHFTLHQPKLGCRGLSFVMEGVTAFRPSRHPNSGMSSFARHSAPSIAFYSRMGASTRGIALGSPHSSVRRHTSVWEKSPPRFDRVSADSSKQRLQGFCSTTRTFLPPTERSDRGNTSVGHRTRVLQPLLPCSKERRRPEAHSGSAASEFFPLQRKVQDADGENHHVSDPRRGLVCHYRPRMRIFTSRSFRDTGGSFGLPLEGRLTNTRSCISAWPWCRERSQNAWMLHWPL